MVIGYSFLAARRNMDGVTMTELEESIERVMAGPQRKSRVIGKGEKKIIAYHEAGHALLSLFVKNADPMHKVTIISRGMALGYTFNPPKKDRYIKSRSHLLAEITVALGGRACEELFFKDISTGAHNDLNMISFLAREMVTQFGMSDNLGNVTYGRRHEHVFLGRDIMEEKNYSEETAKLIDEEVKKLIDGCYLEAKSLLNKNKAKLKLLADTLLEKEVMDDVEVKKLLSIKDIEHDKSDDTEIAREDGAQTASKA